MIYKNSMLILLVAGALALATGYQSARAITNQSSPEARAASWTFEGRVYAGVVGDESHPIPGVTVSVFGANNPYPDQGVFLRSTTTDGAGWYGLTVDDADGSWEFYHILETDPPGFNSVGATSVDGVVREPNWIEYVISLTGKTLTGNKFWDEPQMPPFASHLYLPFISQVGGEEEPFFEEFPAWRLPDLAITSLIVEPDRIEPGQEVHLIARVSSVGSGTVGESELVFNVDGNEVGRIPVEPLDPNTERVFEIPWVAETPGRHQVGAELAFPEMMVDFSDGNNLETGLLRVAGGATPAPELEFQNLSFDQLPLVPGEGRILLVTLRNPSFDPVFEIPVRFFIDGEAVAEDLVAFLAPGEEQVMEFVWAEVTLGQHMVEALAELPDDFPYRELQQVKSWTVIVPDLTITYDTFVKNKWVSIGPSVLNNGSVGRMDAMSIFPTNSSLLYAGAPTGGVWKSTDSGSSWSAMSDKLSRIGITAIAVDPKNSQIVYAATGAWWENSWAADAPIFKSIDGGQNWHTFATGVMQGTSRLEIRYPSAGKVLIYAATNKGLLRYTSSSPSATTSTAAEWTTILTGNIQDMAVHPTNPSTVYASVFKWVNNSCQPDGLYRTKSAQTATGDSDWVKLSGKGGLPDINKKPGYSFMIDIWKANTSRIYVAMRKPGALNVGGVDIYSSSNEGDAWQYEFDQKDTDAGFDVQYNPFIRVHPAKEILYYGGIKLYKAQKDQGQWSKAAVAAVHADQKTLVFDPQNADVYYSLNDGGVWRCSVASSDACVARNNNLRTTQFYDFDVSASTANLMLGGTQDNGTILYEGNAVWKQVRGGDGMYSLIAPSNSKVMYSQHQFIRDTQRSVNGGAGWTNANNGLPTTGYGWYDAYITVHPKFNDFLLAQGTEVYATWDGGQYWEKKGPKGTNVKGVVKRVVFQPQTFDWIAGTTKGQLWLTSNQGISWNLIFTHPDANAVVTNIAFAPTNYKVMYVTFDYADPYRRILRMEMAAGGGWPSFSWITDNLPTKHAVSGTSVRVLSISGDGYTETTAYVGTDKGVFRGTAACGSCTWDWKPYNDGLPLVEVKDLLVDPKLKRLHAVTWGRGAWSVLTGP